MMKRTTGNGRTFRNMRCAFTPISPRMGKSVTLTIRAITCVWWKRIGDAGASLFMVYGEKMPFVQMVITGERLFARKGQGFSMVLSFSGNPFLEKEMIQEMS